MKYFVIHCFTCLLLTLYSVDVLAINSDSYGFDDSTCEIQPITAQSNQDTKTLDIETETLVSFTVGKNILKLTCSLNEQSVFSFARDEILHIHWDQNLNITRLPANQPSFLLPVGQFSVEFEINNHALSKQPIYWQSVASHLNQSVINNTTMGAFYGLCLTLILYVFFMGRVLGDNRFQLYSFYVFCAATFFLLQEGQLDIILPEHSILLSHQIYLLFAGLTVFSATVFIVRLADLHQQWPKISNYLLLTGSFIVMLISILIGFGEHDEVSAFFGVLMARLTLFIMLVLLILVAIKAYRKEKIARLIFISLLLMVVAMIFRVVFRDFNPFLTRYALIIAFAVEAFFLAVAVSSRIKSIKLDQVKAEKDANTDALCKIHNRRGWELKAEELIIQQKLDGGILSLLYIDLNDFKQINDTYGHDSGDKVLIIISKILKKQMRENDIVGRVGGDEFVALGHFENEQQASTLAKRIKLRLSALHLNVNEATSIAASASVGHVNFTTPPASIPQMLDQADKSMYRNKKSQKETK